MIPHTPCLQSRFYTFSFTLSICITLFAKKEAFLLRLFALLYAQSLTLSICDVFFVGNEPTRIYFLAFTLCFFVTHRFKPDRTMISAISCTQYTTPGFKFDQTPRSQERGGKLINRNLRRWNERVAISFWYTSLILNFNQARRWTPSSILLLNLNFSVKFLTCINRANQL